MKNRNIVLMLFDKKTLEIVSAIFKRKTFYLIFFLIISSWYVLEPQLKSLKGTKHCEISGELEFHNIYLPKAYADQVLSLIEKYKLRSEIAFTNNRFHFATTDESKSVKICLSTVLDFEHNLQKEVHDYLEFHLINLNKFISIIEKIVVGEETLNSLILSMEKKQELLVIEKSMQTKSIFIKIDLPIEAQNKVVKNVEMMIIAFIMSIILVVILDLFKISFKKNKKTL